MSLDIWPPVGPEEAKVKMAEVQVFCFLFCYYSPLPS